MHSYPFIVKITIIQILTVLLIFDDTTLSAGVDSAVFTADHLIDIMKCKYSKFLIRKLLKYGFVFLDICITIQLHYYVYILSFSDLSLVGSYCL